MKKIYIIVGLFVVVIVGAFLLTKSDTPTPTPDTVVEYARQVPEGFKEYKNTTYGFSLLYPKGIVINEPTEDASTATITFQDVDNGTGFQIFIVPNNSPKISEERFKKDVPSGVRTDVKNVVVDSTQAVSFYSRDVFLGETYEVWFIHDDFLYEVTTLRVLEDWVSATMETWLFI